MIAAAIAMTSALGAYAGWGDAESPGTLLGNTETSDMSVAQTSDGSTYVVWTTGSVDGYSVHAQFLNQQGEKMWGEDGILVDNHATASWYSYWNILVTPDDGLVISWADARSEEEEGVISGLAHDPVLYKLDKEGNMLWGEDGVTLDSDLYRYPAQLFLVGSNVYAKCLSADDYSPSQLLLLGEDGQPAWSAGKDFGGQIIASEDDDFIGVYPTSDGVVAMRYSKDMRQRWKQPALISQKQYGGYDLNPYQLVSDGEGGTAVCYLTPLGDFAHMPLVAYVSGEGETIFAEDVAATEDFDHVFPVMNVNPENMTIMTIWQLNYGPGGALQGAQMDYFGERMWGDTGVPLAEKSYDEGDWGYGPIAVEPLEGGEWLVCYAEEFGWLDYQLNVGRYDSQGNEVWSRKTSHRSPIISPKLFMRGTTVDLIWNEDYSYHDETGELHSISTLNGVRLDCTSGVEETAAVNEDRETQYYTIDGIRLDRPVKGLNIVRKADGTTSKTFIK